MNLIGFSISLYNHYIINDGHPMLIISSACTLILFIISKFLKAIGKKELNMFLPTPYFWIAAITTSIVY